MTASDGLGGPARAEPPLLDPDLEVAVRNWTPRFLAHGVDPNDLDRITGGIAHWADWLDAWIAAGDVHRELAEDASARGRDRTAGEAFVRAALYYHFGKFLWLEDHARYRETTKRSVGLLRRGMSLLDDTFERLEIPFERDRIVGNLRRPSGAERPPVVILVPGMDSTKEELPGWEETFLRRGLATVSLDGPGQGESGFINPIRPDFEAPVAALLDHLERRTDLDPGRVGITGIGMGDYFASRAAAFEPRLGAVAVIGGPYAFTLRAGLSTAKFMFSAHLDDEAAARALADRFTLEGVASRISQPYLVIHGGRCPTFRWQDSQRKAAEAPRGEFVLYPDGGTVCYSVGPPVRDRLADWFLDRFDR